MNKYAFIAEYKVGDKHGCWTILEIIDKEVRCQCECGNIKTFKKIYLTNHYDRCIKCPNKPEYPCKHKFILNEKIGCLTSISLFRCGGKRYVKVQCKCGKQANMLISVFKNNTMQFCEKCRGFSLEGQQFGRLTVISETYMQGQRKWKCQCECGNFSYPTSTALLRGYSRSCGCYNQEVRKSKADKIGEISKTFWVLFLRKAKTRNIDVKITRQDAWDKFLEQNRKCALTGIELTFSNCTRDYSGTASIDRINSQKDYTLDNIQWVHKIVNIMKWDLDEKTFIEYCKAIVNKYILK